MQEFLELGSKNVSICDCYDLRYYFKLSLTYFRFSNSPNLSHNLFSSLIVSSRYRSQLSSASIWFWNNSLLLSLEKLFFVSRKRVIASSKKSFLKSKLFVGLLLQIYSADRVKVFPSTRYRFLYNLDL